MAFIPSRIKKHKTEMPEAKLTLTSMLDTFTVLLIFLLQMYSTDGQLISPSKYLTLPNSSVEEPPEVGLDVVVSKNMILVNNEKVVTMDDVTANDPKVVENGVIKPLRERLLFYSSQAKKMEVDYGVKFSGKVVIQGDKDLAYAELVKVMRTCGTADYPNMRLAVYRPEVH
jgi:biopolymer transport protein ExbD